VTFRDHFSRQAKLYSIYRPDYPPELFEYLAALPSTRRRAWDCATGSGQAAVALSLYFDEVIATDASPQQIAHACEAEKVRYAVTPASKSGIEDETVDLVTVAQALHWFDVDEFFLEARRVLKPDGVIAVWGYGDPVFEEPSIDKTVRDFNRGAIEKYWTGNRDLLLHGYRTLPFPFREITPPAFRLEKRWTLPELIGYFHTWSATNRFIADRGHDPVPDVESDLSKLWGPAETKRLVVWPLFLRVGYRD
jgi:SAM-dependent methyltransferase